LPGSLVADATMPVSIPRRRERAETKGIHL
jgi:hypothetical protein